MICAKIQPQGILEKIFKGFYHIWARRPSWSMGRNHFSNLSFPFPKEVHMKFEQHWPRGFRGEVVWNSQHFSHTNVWCPYNCIGKQTWPRRKMVKCQYTTIILATLVDLLSPMICAKIQPQGILCSGEEDFWRFYHIWAWWPSWSMDCDHFSNLSFPGPKEAPHEIWATLARRLQCRSHLKFSTFFPYKCMVPIQMYREANLTSL